MNAEKNDNARQPASFMKLDAYSEISPVVTDTIRLLWGGVIPPSPESPHQGNAEFVPRLDVEKSLNISYCR